jgi:hypothetical protein
MVAMRTVDDTPMKPCSTSFRTPLGPYVLRLERSTAEHLKSLLPHLHEMLASRLPPDVMEQIKQHVPGFAQAME